MSIHGVVWSAEGSVSGFRLLFRLCPPLEARPVSVDASTPSCSSSLFLLEPVGVGFDLIFGWVG